MRDLRVLVLARSTVMDKPTIMTCAALVPVDDILTIVGLKLREPVRFVPAEPFTISVLLVEPPNQVRMKRRPLTT